MTIKAFDMAPDLKDTYTVTFGALSRMRHNAADQYELDTDESYWQLLAKDFQESGCDILSLDVFDTLLMRDQKSELSRFYEISVDAVQILEKHGAVPGSLSAQDILVLRNFATLSSYRASNSLNGCREGCLQDIYLSLSRTVLGNSSAAEDLISNELNYESSHLQLSKAISRLIEHHHANGGTTICISDMYMKSSHIRAIMDTISPEISSFVSEVYSSSNQIVSKSSGLIFDFVSDTLKADPSRFYHVGDALVGDYQQPRKRGWRSLYLPVPRQMQQIRLDDHVKTEKDLLDNHGIKVRIAPPQVN